MTGRIDRRRLLAAGMGLGLAAAAPRLARAADAPVRVSSKPDTEGGLLGNMIVKVLQANGVPVQPKLGLGPTSIMRRAILAGEIDLYPEYTGNGAFFFHIDSDPVWKDAHQGYEKVKSLDAANHLVWLPPAPANNTWAIAVRGNVAGPAKLVSMADFGKWVDSGGPVKLAASAEFVESPAALPSFQKAYGFALKPAQIITLAGGDTSATIRAAAEGTSGVNCAMAYGTDGALASLGMVVMQDTKGAQMVYEPAPVVRESVLTANPRIATLLAPVFASLDAATLQKLNASIAVDGNDAGQVANDYLHGKGFLK